MRQIRTVTQVLSSMRLSILLLACSLILVFFGTLDQVHYGIYETQRRYFQSLIAFWQFPLEWPGGKFLHWFVLPMPGGYMIGPLFMLNLVFAHFRYFKPRLKSLGIVMIHGGLGLLLVGQLFTDIGQEEFQMWIDEGARSNYAESFFENELVLIDRSGTESDKVFSIPESKLKNGVEFEHPDSPIRLRVQQYFQNARIMQLQEGQTAGLVVTTHGVGSRMRLGVLPAAPVYSQNERNVATAVVEVLHEGKPVGNWLVANVFNHSLPNQTMEIGGRQYEIAMQFKRRYFPFFIHLADFTHDIYPGTEIPRNYSSQVEVDNRETGEKRDALIYMNHPLRYGGYTFYQASFGNNDQSSMLQVVRNPGWMIPYLSCLLMTVGMLWQFGWTLVGFAERMRK